MESMKMTKFREKQSALLVNGHAQNNAYNHERMYASIEYWRDNPLSVDDLRTRKEDLERRLRLGPKPRGADESMSSYCCRTETFNRDTPQLLNALEFALRKEEKGEPWRS